MKKWLVLCFILPTLLVNAEVVSVSQDATISGATPDATDGGNTKIFAKDSPMQMAYIQFSSPSYAVTDIISMTAYSDILTSKPRSSSVYLITNNVDVAWDQSTLTWNNAPANNLLTKYPDTAQTALIGSFGSPAANTKQAVSFNFFDVASKSLLIDAMNSYDAVTLVLVRPSTYLAAYSSLENTINDPIQMTVVPEPATIGMLGVGALVAVALRRKLA